MKRFQFRALTLKLKRKTGVSVEWSLVVDLTHVRRLQHSQGAALIAAQQREAVY